MGVVVKDCFYFFVWVVDEVFGVVLVVYGDVGDIVIFVVIVFGGIGYDVVWLFLLLFYVVFVF